MCTSMFCVRCNSQRIHESFDHSNIERSFLLCRKRFQLTSPVQALLRVPQALRRWHACVVNLLPRHAQERFGTPVRRKRPPLLLRAASAFPAVRRERRILQCSARRFELIARRERRCLQCSAFAHCCAPLALTLAARRERPFRRAPRAESFCHAPLLAASILFRAASPLALCLAPLQRCGTCPLRLRGAFLKHHARHAASSLQDEDAILFYLRASFPRLPKRYASSKIHS